MNVKFSKMLAEGGKKNSLGLVPEVINIVLDNQSRLEELFACVFNENAWIRMRAIDAFEKISRLHPVWLEPYITRIQSELSKSSQASVQWHIAQIYSQVSLDKDQRKRAIDWLVSLLSKSEIDWIVSANCMKTLADFTSQGFYKESDLVVLLKIQLGHQSNAVTKRATKLLSEFS